MANGNGKKKKKKPWMTLPDGSINPEWAAEYGTDQSIPGPLAPAQKPDKGNKGNKGSGGNNNNNNPDKNTAADKLNAVSSAVNEMKRVHSEGSIKKGWKGGTTDIVTNNKTLVHGPSDVLTPEDRKRLAQLTGGYGSSTIG